MIIKNLQLANTLVFVMIGLVIINTLFVLGAMFAANRQVANAKKAFAGIRKQTMGRLEDLRIILAKTYKVQKKIPEVLEKYKKLPIKDFHWLIQRTVPKKLGDMHSALKPSQISKSIPENKETVRLRSKALADFIGLTLSHRKPGPQKK